MPSNSLYTSDGSRKSNGSEYSEEDIEKQGRKELIGKKKERGYATLDGDESPDDSMSSKSPFKGRKNKKAFKFSSKKEKPKDKESEKKKDAEKKRKVKDKKAKNNNSIGDDLPLFGVSLESAVQRNPCHDGILIPVLIRDCIDFVEQNGLSVEGIYKTLGVKAKVQHACAMYNKRQPLPAADFDLTVATGVLKYFLRSLPESILTNTLSGQFEDISTTSNPNNFKSLIQRLPQCNLHFVSVLFSHLKKVAAYEKRNKMSVASLGSVFCPLLEMSPQLFGALMTNAERILPPMNLGVYQPPLRCVSPFICSYETDQLEMELRKQESLLNLIHFEMNAGFVNDEKEESLWAIQRNITQLKRKLKCIERENRRVSDDAASSNEKLPAPLSINAIPIFDKVEVTPQIEQYSPKLDVYFDGEMEIDFNLQKAKVPPRSPSVCDDVFVDQNSEFDPFETPKQNILPLTPNALRDFECNNEQFISEKSSTWPRDTNLICDSFGEANFDELSRYAHFGKDSSSDGLVEGIKPLSVGSVSSASTEEIVASTISSCSVEIEKYGSSLERLNRSSAESHDNELSLKFENKEMVNFIQEMQMKIKSEITLINRLSEELKNAGINPESDVGDYFVDYGDAYGDTKQVDKHRTLLAKRHDLLTGIMEENEAIINLKAQIALAQAHSNDKFSHRKHSAAK